LDVESNDQSRPKSHRATNAKYTQGRGRRPHDHEEKVENSGADREPERRGILTVREKTPKLLKDGLAKIDSSAA